MHRGSRKHVLDWLESPRFVPEFLQILSPIDVKVVARSSWAPVSHQYPDEARLEEWGPQNFGMHPAWSALSAWWLKKPRRANTPNWDLAMIAEIEGALGLVLVEAKANVREIGSAGKSGPTGSDGSCANHECIGEAIASARTALQSVCPGIAISRDSNYQLSNRIAFTWKLASLGIPVALIYLGFVGDDGICDVSSPFVDDAHWQSVLREHLQEVGAESLFEKRHQLSGAPFWFLSRSRRVLEISPTVAG
jgi:hypothetical protein